MARKVMKAAPRGRGKSVKFGGLNPEDMEDDIDQFHKQRDKILLESEDEIDDEDSEEEETVFDIKGAEDSDEDDENEEDEEDEEDEENFTGLAAKLAKQAKFMRQKTGGAKEDDSDEGGEEGDEEKDTNIWGKNKRAYYSADNVDYELQSDDEETPFEEEQEVLKLQKKMASSLKPEDYEQDDDIDNEEEEEEEQDKAMGDRAKPGTASGKSKSDTKEGEEAMAVETVPKDMSALSKEQQMEVLMSDAPELVGLLSDLKSSLDELRNKVQPLLEQVRSGTFATAEGLSYLETKNLLLLSYCGAIVFYLMLRAEGRSVRDHPVIARLVEIRLYLEKIRPIDKKLQYQVEKLLSLARSGEGNRDQDKATAEEADRDALTYRPNPEMLVSKLDPESQDPNAVYRPPKLAASAMEEPAGKSKKAERDRVRLQKRAELATRKSSFVRELASEMEGRPEEIGFDEMGGINNSKVLREEREKLRARAEEEERMFARVPLKREERKKLKGLKKGNHASLGGLLEDFDDEVGGLLGAEGADGETGGGAGLAGGPPEGLLKRRKLSQVVAEAGRAGNPKTKVTSGDMDVPERPELGDRRRAQEQREMRRTRADEDADVDGEGEEEEAVQAEEDEVYRSAKEGRAARLAQKKQKYGQELVGNIPREEELVEGKRAINRDIEKNRGLTPHRNKLVRNPRKKYKVAHAKAVVRRKGQVRDVQREMAPYAGQATGIKSNVTRSVRLAP